MKLVPVIDLMNGCVVHARRGERESYRPIRSALCLGSDPVSIAGALLDLHPFDTLYIADLDAIRGTGDNRPALQALRQAFPGMVLWVDAGISNLSSYRAFCAAGLGVPVIGSENLTDASLVADLAKSGQEAILSLDFKEGSFLGPAALFTQPQAWPRRILSLNLDHVGSRLGPDFKLLHTLLERAPDREIYAAGGVRGADDLERLRTAGAAGVLLASALHDGSLPRSELARYR